MKAIWHDTVIADSAATVVVEGNHYFPPEAVRKELLRPSRTRTTCPWKGVASYYHVVVGGAENRYAAWSYAEPKPAARNIQNHVAFWKGVQVVD